MNRSLLLAALLAVGTTACVSDGHTPVPAPPAPAAPIDTNTTVALTPLDIDGLRYDGVYLWVDGSLHYYMRFFQRGTVALVAGPDPKNDTIPSIRTYLTEDVQSGWNSVHNTTVVQRNDSLFFRTMASKGAITYACVLQRDTLVALKESQVNGRRAILRYHFEADRP